MSKVSTGPTGNTIKGNVLDVNPKAFEKALQDYDNLLYIKWNPKKLRGWGCWEIRRKTSTPIAVYKGTYQGINYFSVERPELDLVNHILDCAYLNYDQIRKLKEMDTWKDLNWVANMEYKGKVWRAEQWEKTYKERIYQMKQNSTLLRDYRDAILSGTNPAEIARYWK